MQKKSIFIVLIVLVFAFSILSLYSSFAYNEEENDLGDSDANYNLIYSLKDENSKKVSVASNDYIYIDIDFTNNYNYAVRYGTYYYLIDPTTLPTGVEISAADGADTLLEDTIQPGEERTISLKIVNNSEYNVDLFVGTLVGFENGKIEDLVTEGIHLIK